MIDPDQTSLARTGLHPSLPFGLPPLEAFLAVARLSHDAVVLVRDDDECSCPVVAWNNPEFDHLLGQPTRHLVGQPVDAVQVRPLGDEPAAASSSRSDDRTLAWLLDPALGRPDISVRRADGSTAVVRASVASVATQDTRYWAVMLREIGQEVRADEQLRASEERFRALAGNAPIGIFFSEIGLRLGYVNDRFADLLGRPTQELLGMGWLDAVHPADVEGLVAALSRVLSGDEVAHPVRIHRATGELRWLLARATPMRLPGRGAGFIGSLEDVTEGRRHEQALAHQANHDFLTGLPNRTLLWTKLSAVLEGRRASDPAVALLFFDIDNFKLVNDSLGHLVGDQLLVKVASRLREHVRPEDVVARLGGDEFVVLCPAVDSEAAAVAIADRLLAVLDEPLRVEPFEIRITASVGVALSHGRDADAETLVRDADVAMYQAKGAGKARCAVFDAQVRSGIEDRLSLTMDLRRAIETGELTVAYQPVVGLRTGMVTGVEALARWNHPVRGPIPPAEFVALAEETGMIDLLGRWVLNEACQQLARWRAELGEAAPPCIAANLSARQLVQPDLPAMVLAAVSDAGLDPGDLCLELTETVLMADAPTSMTALSTLRQLGVRFAIDDFGTGYSSLAYLRRFSVELLKIDRSFVEGLDDDGEDAAIVGAIVSLARSLGLTVVAEGVQTHGQLRRLVELGCDHAQGFVLGEPASASALTERLRQGRSWPVLAPVPNGLC